MKLRCQAPGRTGGRLCGRFLGESRTDVEFRGHFKRVDDYLKRFPSPFHVTRCRECGRFSVYELAENGLE